MKTPNRFGRYAHQLRLLAALASLAFALPVQATFHLVQIEQVIGGVNGDTTAQAIQLRMRAPGQGLVTGVELVAFDASGSNPIILATFSTNVGSSTGQRILITTASFASYETTPITSDFTMTAIPASYLAAGRLVYRKPTYQAGAAVWSLSWGGANYSGPNTGTIDNDADGNFAPPFAGVLPSTSTISLLFPGSASAPSTNNAADYALSTTGTIFTNNVGASTSLISGGTPTPTPGASPSTLANISTRLRVETGDSALIGGFIITGTQPKKVIVRAIGPSLPFPGALADPILELRNSSGGLIGSNDNWPSDQEAEIIATGIPPTIEFESALVAILPANGAAYTAIVRGVNNGTGVGLAEVYDLDPAVDSKLANISTRGLVQTGDNVLIGGLIVRGQNPLRVIVRAIGPSLPVAGALGNPTLELRDGDGAQLAANDDWRIGGHEAEIIATGIPPSNDLESAIVLDLPPGPYTAIVRGVGDTTGVALVEVYALN